MMVRCNYTKNGVFVKKKMLEKNCEKIFFLNVEKETLEKNVENIILEKRNCKRYNIVEMNLIWNRDIL